MKSDFFYSPSTGIYMALGPLKIDSRVKKAAEDSKLILDWDDEGRINNIDFDDAKKLLKCLGSFMLTPVEYWKVMNDAKKARNKEILDSLTSNKFCEWLNRAYFREGTFVESPKVVGKYKYSGKKQKSFYPIGTPSWFNPKRNINYTYGIPKKVEIFREKFTASWKYWSPNLGLEASPLGITAPVRGYVTSVGKPSFDLGIPVDSRQPMLMIRECRKIPLSLPIKQEILNKWGALSKCYEDISKNPRRRDCYNKFYLKSNQYIDFAKKYGLLFKKSKELTTYKTRERILDVLGLLKIIAISKNNKKRAEKIGEVARGILGNKYEKMTYIEFADFVKSLETRLNLALKENKGIIFVMGHKNPDTDTCVSSLFEAYRNSLMDKDAEYIPIVQAHRIPDEAKRLLGNEISNSIILSKEPIYEKAKKTGLCRWISVDQNREPEVQKYFVSIIDHHVISDVAKNQELPKTLEMIGSCTALITNKILGMGLHFDSKIAKILYGATLMDTENRVAHKMTVKDAVIMDYLKRISETKNDEEFYSDLMSCLLNTDDPKILFGRDYKEDWGFGFAVAKVKHAFDKRGNILKKDLVDKALNLAEQNNNDKNLPLTVVKITDYKDDNKTVNKERVCLIFNKNTSKEFIETTSDLLQKHILFEFGRGFNFRIRKSKNFIEFWGTGVQLSRKKTAPVLEPVVKAFNEYFYSPSINLWIKRDFLKKTNLVKKAMKELRIKMSTDYKNRINYITYPEAKRLVNKISCLIMSLKEYWIVLNDAKRTKDIQMIESLQGSNFVEFLDTIIKNKRYAIEHPKLKDNLIIGKEKEVFIPKGKPGLMHPDNINLNTGIPKIIRKPNEYGNPELWRYWEPDSDLIIPTRSYIFLLKQPCWDGKFHLDDSFPNLGIRPCCKKVIQPKVKIKPEKNSLNIQIYKEGDLIEHKWKRLSYNLGD